MSTAVIVPFRDRGLDPLRAQNLQRVLEHWEGYDCTVLVMNDGRTGDAQFNRSAAYNRGVKCLPDADTFIFSESDLLIDYAQIDHAVEMAATPGLVIPFSWFIPLREEESRLVRAGADPAECFNPPPIRGHRGSIGAINVISRHTYDLVGGYDEAFEGAWYDDDAMKLAFEVAAGPTRWVEGSAHHLYHLSGGAGAHLSRADRAATSRNRLRLREYQRARSAEQIRKLTGGAV
jgi:hypothetical protein